MVLGEETARAKALRQDLAWCVGGTARRPQWLEKNERGREREKVRAGRGDRSRSCRAVWAKGKTEGLTLRKVLTGALRWLLWGGQAWREGWEQRD